MRYNAAMEKPSAATSMPHMGSVLFFHLLIVPVASMITCILLSGLVTSLFIPLFFLSFMPVLLSYWLSGRHMKHSRQAILISALSSLLITPVIADLLFIFLFRINAFSAIFALYILLFITILITYAFSFLIYFAVRIITRLINT